MITISVIIVLILLGLKLIGIFIPWFCVFLPLLFSTLFIIFFYSPSDKKKLKKMLQGKNPYEN